MTERLDTIVVGAGMAGLAYAQARGPGAELLVLEASSRAGGLVATARGEGCHWETGPEALQDNEPAVLAMLDELDVVPSAAAPAARRRFVVSARHGLVAVPSSPGGLLGTPLLSPRGKLALVAGLFRRGGVLDGSIADFVTSRFGRQTLERLVDPAVSGIWASDPACLSFAGALPALHEMLVEHGSVFAALRAKGRARRAAGLPRPPPPSLLSTEGGLEAIPAAVARQLGERLLLEHPVERIAADDDGWRVEAGGRGFAARRCVLALPAARAAQVLAQDQPALAQLLSTVVSESVASMAHTWRRSDLGHALDGFGYLMPSQLGAMHLGTLFSSSIQPSRAAAGTVILRTLIGGARHPELLDRDDDQLLEIVASEVGPLLGAVPDARPLAVHVTRWREVLPRYDLDHPARQATIDALLSERSGLHVLGNHRRGISVSALVKASRELAREHGHSP